MCTQNQNFASQLKDVRRNFDTTLDPTFKYSEKISLTGNFGWLYDDDGVDNESAELTARWLYKYKHHADISSHSLAVKCSL